VSDDREFQKHWKELAERISKERHPSKIIELSQELIDMLEEHSQKPQPERKRHKKSA
jgi:hypothetical protein